MTENLRIRSGNPADADELLAIRRDAIMALAEEYGAVAAERWATAAPPDRAAKAIAHFAHRGQPCRAIVDTRIGAS